MGTRYEWSSTRELELSQASPDVSTRHLEISSRNACDGVRGEQLRSEFKCDPLAVLQIAETVGHWRHAGRFAAH